MLSHGASPGKSHSLGILTGAPLESTKAQVTLASIKRSSPRRISWAKVPLAAPFLRGQVLIVKRSSVIAGLL